MKSKKIIAVVGGSFLLAAAFLLILCIKFVNMKESSPTGKYAGKTEKVEQTTTDKKEQKKPDWVEEKNFRDDIGRKSGSVIYHYAGVWSVLRHLLLIPVSVDLIRSVRM